MKVNVRSGDTIWYYSQLFYIPLPLIVDSNPSVNPNSLQVGQQINIPGFITSKYVLKRGDSFWKLAQTRNLSVDALLIVNPKLNPNRLEIGETVLIPKRVVTPVVKGKTQYGYERLNEDIETLQSIYPFMRVNSIGKSVNGRKIYELTIGRGEKKVHFNGSFHANEWITTPIIMRFVNDYLLALTNQASIRGIGALPLYENTNLSVVPMVNPDGVELVLNGPPEQLKENLIKINKGNNDFSGWKANIRGVDLNNQFPAKWEIEKERKEEKSPAPRDYPGEAPLTEPEAIAMADLARNNNFDRLLAFHTQGREFYWGYEGLEPKEAEVLANQFERLSGYKSVKTIDSYAGYKDWFIQEYKKPGFTIELGKGINPLPLSQYDEIYENALGIFLGSLYL